MCDARTATNGNARQRGKDVIMTAWARSFEGAAATFSWHADVVEVREAGDLALSSGPVTRQGGDCRGRFRSTGR